MSGFEAIDFYNVNEGFSATQKELRHKIRQAVDQHILPVITDCHMQGRFPEEIIPVFAELGLYGPTIKGYGCGGLDYTSYGLMMQEVERGDSGIRSFVSVHGALAMFPIAEYAHEQIKSHLLPKMAKGELIGCFGLTEPDFGSNPSGMITQAKKQGGSYVLNGHKRWATNGGIADIAIIWAKGDDGKVSGFIVDTKSKGLTIKPIEKKYSLMASVSSEIILENVAVPEENKLNVSGLKGPFSCLNLARYGIAWGSLGAAMACFDEALQYSKNRVQFSKPIAGYQLVQQKLAHMFTEITKGQLLAQRLGQLLDADNWIPQQISMAKMNNVAVALDAARTCRDILGANGVTHDYQCGRHMVNMESVKTYEGTEDIHKLILGQHITGIPAFDS